MHVTLPCIVGFTLPEPDSDDEDILEIPVTPHVLAAGMYRVIDEV